MPNAPLLISLDVQNLGIVEGATLEFSRGFTAITGETGAGKTLIVDALMLCMGGDVRAAGPSDGLRVAALFDDGVREVLLQRTSVSGRLRALIDGSTTSSEALRRQASELIAIHGQHDSMRLRSSAEMLALLDGFGGIDDANLRSLRREYTQAQEELDALGGSVDQRAREVEFLRFQLNEIDSAQIQSENELTQAIDELSELTVIRDSSESVNRLLEIFDATEQSAFDVLFGAVNGLAASGSIGEIRSALTSQLDALRETSRDLRRYSEFDEGNAARFDELSTRIDVLRNLERKFGGSILNVLAERDRMGGELRKLEESELRFTSLSSALGKLESDFEYESERIRSLRAAAATRFSESVTANLAEVALPAATLDVVVSGRDGSEVAFVFRPNPGSTGGPIQSIASGGELSRVLLAIALSSGTDGIVTVFDEIDAGVGGAVAQSIGSCLARLAQSQQVIAVTHLASVAAKADHHFVVAKRVAGDRTVTTVTPLSPDERVSELARMLAGDASDEAARALATTMLAK